MRKNLIGALIASAFAFSGTAQAGLLFDFDGNGAASGAYDVTAFDWAQTSFLALNGNAAIGAYVTSNGACAPVSSCQFDVLTHARLTGFTLSGGGTGTLPTGFGEITMVARYTEQVTDFSVNSADLPRAEFSSTGAGWVEFYYSAADSVDLTGSGFNNGTLIGRLTGVTVGATGAFRITSNTAVIMDQAINNIDNYAGQETVTGSGDQDILNAGLVSKDLDLGFFLTSLAGFSLNYNNISIGLPYTSANPSDCFSPNQAAAAVGTTGLGSTCADNHDDALKMDGQANDGGYNPTIGSVNGLNLGSPDFVAQTDFNSALNGAIPEPGSLALAGLALAALGAAASRRRRA